MCTATPIPTLAITIMLHGNTTQPPLPLCSKPGDHSNSSTKTSTSTPSTPLKSENWSRSALSVGTRACLLNMGSSVGNMRLCLKGSTPGKIGLNWTVVRGCSCLKDISSTKAIMLFKIALPIQIAN